MTVVDDALTELLELHTASEVVLEGVPRRPWSRVRGGLPTGLCLDEEALDARARVLGVLSSWCGLVASECGDRHPGRHSVRELVMFLRKHRAWLVDHPASDDLAAEIQDLVDECRRLVEPDSPRRVIGRCRRAGCGRPVWAVLGAGAPPRVVCDGGHEWSRREWLLLADVS